MTKYHRFRGGASGYEGTTMKPRTATAGAQPQQYKSAVKAVLAGVLAAVVVFVVIASLTRSNLTSASALLSAKSSPKASGADEMSVKLVNTGEKGTASRQSVYTDIPILDIDKKPLSMSSFEGKVTLIVNVATHCGLTPSNYAGLEEVQLQYESKGFSVVAFPCNQFGQQENGTNAEIKAFAASKHATFPLMDKIDVNGEDAIPLYKAMKDITGGGDVKWNFEKFLVSKEGIVVRRYRPQVLPQMIKPDIEALLAKKQLDVAVMDAPGDEEDDE